MEVIMKRRKKLIKPGERLSLAEILELFDPPYYLTFSKDGRLVFDKSKSNKLNNEINKPRVALKPGDARYEKLKNSMEAFGHVEALLCDKSKPLTIKECDLCTEKH
jgi:hypothetical protein